MKKSYLIAFILVFVLGVMIVSPAGTNAVASIFYTPITAQTSQISTSTLTVMRAGLATSTISINSDVVGPGFSLDQVTLLVQMNATTTGSPVLNFQVEDSINNVDWYARGNTLAVSATSTPVTGNSAEYRINFASTTANITTTGTTTRVAQSFTFPVNAKYTRVVFTTPIGGGQSGLYARLIGKAQNR